MSDNKHKDAKNAKLPGWAETGADDDGIEYGPLPGEEKEMTRDEVNASLQLITPEAKARILALEKELQEAVDAKWMKQEDANRLVDDEIRTALMMEAAERSGKKMNTEARDEDGSPSRIQDATSDRAGWKPTGMSAGGSYTSGSANTGIPKQLELHNGNDDPMGWKMAGGGSSSSIAGYVSQGKVWKVCTHKPQQVIVGDGFEVWAGKKWDAAHYGSQYNMVLNLSGTSLAERHRIPFAGLKQWENYDAANEIQLDWTDGSDINLPLQFWRDVIETLRTNHYRALVYCIGGHGRTGTALGAMLVTLGKTAREAIHLIRTQYCDEAIETRTQEKYLHALQKQREAADREANKEAKRQAKLARRAARRAEKEAAKAAANATPAQTAAAE